MCFDVQELLQCNTQRQGGDSGPVFWREYVPGNAQEHSHMLHECLDRAQWFPVHRHRSQ